MFVIGLNYGGSSWFLACGLSVGVVMLEMPADRHYGKGDKEFGAKAEEASDQSYSTLKRMSAFPRADTGMSESGNMGLPTLFPQNEGSNSLSGICIYMGWYISKYLPLV